MWIRPGRLKRGFARAILRRPTTGTLQRGRTRQGLQGDASGGAMEMKAEINEWGRNVSAKFPLKVGEQ